MNALSTIAAAVTAGIDAATLTPDPIVERHYVPPDYDTTATNALKVIVIGLEEGVDLNASRSLSAHDYGIRVAILKRIEAADVTAATALAELDALSDFRESVLDLLKSLDVADAELMTIKSVHAQGAGTYDPATLDQKKTYVSVLSLTYRRLR